MYFEVFRLKNIYLPLFALSCYFSFHFVLPSIVLIILFNGLSNNCKLKGILGSNGLKNMKDLINVWMKFSDGFGLYFLIYFGSAQIMLIVLAFNGISKVFLGGFDFSSRHISWIFIFISLGNQENYKIKGVIEHFFLGITPYY